MTSGARDGIDIWTDGSYDRRTGAGAWAAIVRAPDGIKVIRGNASPTDAAQMEHAAIRTVLERADGRHRIRLHTDQKSIVLFMKGEIGAATRHTGTLNRIRRGARGLDVQWCWSPSAGSDPMMKRAHELAVRERRRLEHDIIPATREPLRSHGRECVEEHVVNRRVPRWEADAMGNVLRAKPEDRTRILACTHWNAQRMVHLGIDAETAREAVQARSRAMGIGIAAASLGVSAKRVTDWIGHGWIRCSFRGPYEYGKKPEAFWLEEDLEWIRHRLAELRLREREHLEARHREDAEERNRAMRRVAIQVEQGGDRIKTARRACVPMDWLAGLGIDSQEMEAIRRWRDECMTSEEAGRALNVARGWMNGRGRYTQAPSWIRGTWTEAGEWKRERMWHPEDIEAWEQEMDALAGVLRQVEDRDSERARQLAQAAVIVELESRGEPACPEPGRSTRYAPTRELHGLLDRVASRTSRALRIDLGGLERTLGEAEGEYEIEASSAWILHTAGRRIQARKVNTPKHGPLLDEEAMRALGAPRADPRAWARVLGLAGAAGLWRRTRNGRWRQRRFWRPELRNLEPWHRIRLQAIHERVVGTQGKAVLEGEPESVVRQKGSGST